ncbi:16S rRNA (guanine(1516)-N(2))-methyltransferase [hydrothermal vent metagenome]|uniref:16S rRNA (Guanine(1516)-N(2))-methyltransferase n=1 Tax=hydrothermal vent metagenome TaxID=652676 RepID=A0A3B0UGW6_9ZZZZ
MIGANVPLLPNEDYAEKIKKLSQDWDFDIREESSNDIYALEIIKNRLQLRTLKEPKVGAIYVDFLEGKSLYRLDYGGGRSQAIAKAVGLKKGLNPIVVDATAGLGRDSFVLAALGCRVHMLERSPFVAVLLEDGINRAKEDSRIGSWVTERLSVSCMDSISALSSLLFVPDVVYLDPMFPEKQKSALVKKDMRMIKEIVGSDSDAKSLFNIAVKTAKERVVVKRPAHAHSLVEQKPNTIIETKKNRFEIYLV